MLKRKMCDFCNINKYFKIEFSNKTSERIDFMKLFVVHKDTVIIYFLILAAICSIITLNWDTTAAVFETMAPKKDLPIYCVQKEDKICAISFDAAWGNEDTHTLIEILKKYNIKTTFFVVGEWVDKYPESVKELADAGHEIMNHSNTHPHMTKLSKEQMQKEVTECNNKIESVTNKKPILFRPPYGDYNDNVVSAMRDIGMYTIQWDVEVLATAGNLLYKRVYESFSVKVEIKGLLW